MHQMLPSKRKIKKIYTSRGSHVAACKSSMEWSTLVDQHIYIAG
jgi:hypothetical protein